MFSLKKGRVMPVAARDGTSGNSRTFQGISTPGLDVPKGYIRDPAGPRSCGGVDLGAPRLSLLQACPLSGSVSLCVSLSTLLGWQSSREAPPASLSTPPHTSPCILPLSQVLYHLSSRLFFSKFGIHLCMCWCFLAHSRCG